MAAIIIYCAIRAYNKRMDQITNGEVHGTHSFIPEPQDTVNAVYRAVLMGLAIMTLFSVSTLTGKIFSLESDINNLRSTQDNLYREIYELRTAMENQDKLISSYEFGYKDSDYASHTVTADLSVYLKEYAEDTEVTLILGDREIPMTKGTAGCWSTQFEADFFTSISETPVIIKTGGTRYQENLQLFKEIFYDYLPIPSLECKIDSGLNSYSGWYRIVTDMPEQIQSASVTYMTDNTDLKTVDVTEQAQQLEQINLEKGLKLKKDLTLRIEIITTTGYKITNRTSVIFEADGSDYGEDYIKIEGLDGTTYWYESWN